MRKVHYWASNSNDFDELGMRFTKLLFLQTGPWRETRDELSSLYFLDGSRSFLSHFYEHSNRAFFFPTFLLTSQEIRRGIRSW